MFSRNLIGGVRPDEWFQIRMVRVDELANRGFQLRHTPMSPRRPATLGIVFVLRSGIPWQMLPQELGCGSAYRFSTTEQAALNALSQSGYCTPGGNVKRIVFVR